jgi:hypothetical protein
LTTLAAQIKAQLAAIAQYEHKPGASVDALALFRNAWNGTPDPWQQEILDSDSDRLFLNCARQSGKSTVTSVLAVKTAVETPRSLILILSPTDRQSGLLFKKCKDVYQSSPTLPPLVKCNERSMALANGSEIVSLPGKPDNIRGFSAPRLIIIDEAAFASDQLYRAVRPMLAVGHGTLAILSSPFGKRGFFHSEYETIQDALRKGVKPVWHYIEVPASIVPRITPAFLQEERISLGPMFDQEYMCAFLDSEVAMFSYELVQAALDHGEEFERWF